MSEAVVQIVLLLTLAGLWSALLLAAQLFRNSSLLFLMVGAAQMPQTLLAVAVFIHLTPALTVSPGSTVLFTGTLFAVLLVHILRGPGEARVLIYGVFLVNLFLAAVMQLGAWQVESSLAVAQTGLSPDLLRASAGVIFIGSAVLLIDIVVLVALYESLGRWLKSRFLRIYATLLAVLVIDAVLFYSVNFLGTQQFTKLFVSAVIGKSLVALLYSVVLAYAARRVEQPEPVGLPDILRFLTFRSDLNEILRMVSTDALTGAYSRHYFEQTLDRAVDTAVRESRPAVLAMVDADHFKQVNDRFGHDVGDELLKALAQAIKSAVRDSDAVCRFGGEEFAVIMPDTALASAVPAAERIRSEVAACHQRVAALVDQDPVTVSIGLAECPGEATTVVQLIKLADQRLYQAKRGGRNQVRAGI